MQIAPVESNAALDGLHRLLVEGNPMVWLDHYGRILTKKVDPTTGSKLRQFRANPLQIRLGEIVDYMLAHKLPVRILIYKPRQKGSSTGSVGICDWFLKKFGHKGYLCGNELSNCRNLWDILRTYNTHDNYDWGIGVDVQSNSAKYSNGGSFHWATAKNAESGRSATLGVLLMTEIARWAEDDGAVRDAGKVFSSLMGAVPLEPNTLVIGETTVRGASGVFYEQWQKAKSFEQLKAGDYEYGDFIKVFMPWFVFDDSTLPVTDVEAAGIRDGSTALNDTERFRERELMTRYRLGPPHIKYFRARLKACDYDPEERDREEPTTEESGFFAAQPCYFNKAMLSILRQRAELVQKDIGRGILTGDDPKLKSGVAWEPAMEEDKPLWLQIEKPQVGRRYILSVDNSRGLVPKKGDSKEPDCHAVTVLRDGYLEKETGIWHPPRVVACLVPKCRIDIDLLAEEVAKMAKYHGNCLVVPEANNDCGLIMCLRKLNVHIYERQKAATDIEDQEGTGKYGFWTADDGQGRGVRSELLAELRSAVRRLLVDSEGIDIPFLHILDEMEHFAVNTNTGKAEAQEKWHDDFVMALAFAFFLKGRGTTLAAPTLQAMLPPDVRAMLAHEQRATACGGGGAYRV